MASRLSSPDTEEVITAGFGQHLLKRMAEFHSSDLLCDFKLIVGQQVFQVHRLVLASASDYFRAMFSHDMMETNKNYLELKGLQAEGVRSLIEYAYTGKLSLSMNNIELILAASTFLQVTTAVDLCTEYLKSRLDFENAEDIVRLADMFGISEMEKNYRNYVLENFMSFTMTESFRKLDGKTLAGYLVDDALNSPSEYKLFKCVLAWYNHNKKERAADIYDVVEKIRYVNDGWPLIEFAESSEIFANSAKCEKLLESCVQFMQTPERSYLNQNYRTRVRGVKRTLVQMGGVQEYGCEYPELVLDGRSDDFQSGTHQNRYYHLEHKHWYLLGPAGVLDAKSHCVLVEINNYAILIGGYIYNDAHTEKHATNEVKILTPGGSSGKYFALWDMQYMNIERAQHAGAVIPGFIVIVGGKNQQHVLSSVEMFDLDSEKWMFVRPLEKPLFNHAAAGFKGKVYISGGVEAGEVISSVSCFDPTRDKWESKRSMLAARSGHTMTTLGKQIIVCGGRMCLSSANTRCLSSVESYNPETNQWTFLAPMRYDCSFMAATVLDDKLIVAGGENSISAKSQIVQEYDPQTNKWGLFDMLPKAMKNFGICSMAIKHNTSPDTDSMDSISEAFDSMHMRLHDQADDDVEYADQDGNQGFEPLV